MQTIEQQKETLGTLEAREPKNPTLKDKALYVIETVSMGYFTPCEKVLTACYKYAHVARGVCLNPHEDWKKELEEAYKRMKRE